MQMRSVWLQNKSSFMTLLLTILVLGACSSNELTPDETPLPAPSIALSPSPTTTATLPPQTGSEPALVFSDDNVAPDSIPGEVYFAPYPMSITVDGDLSDWANVPQVTLPETNTTTSPAITFAAAADDNYLYVVADVTDDNIISGEHGVNYWDEDSVEFYFNGTGNHELNTYTDGIAQLTISPINAELAPEEHITSGVQGDTIDADFVVTVTDTGYISEVAVPLENDVWNIPLQHGGLIGFQVHLNSASSSNRDAKLIWSVFDTGDNSYQNPSVFGQLVFFEVGRDDIPEPTPTPTPAPTSTSIPVEEGAIYKDPTMPIEDRVEDLLAHMSLEEKIGQMTLVEKNSILDADIIDYGIGGLLSGGGGYPDPNTPQAWAEMVNDFQALALQTRLQIPILYGADGVHGHNNVYGAVVFPHNIGLGAANDPDLMERIGQVTATEMAATGIYWNYAPAVSVPQDIRWGRTYEGYSENTAIVSRLAAAYLRGLQGEALSQPTTVMATPKHFVGDGGVGWGTSERYQIDRGDTILSEPLLRQIHLPPYIAAIDAGASSIMISYSSWNGTKMHGQSYLMTDVLRDELGFDGMIVSDWGGVDEISSDYYDSVVIAVNAGIDMNMVPYDYIRFVATLTEAVENGDVPIERIDDAVRNILRAKFALGLFEVPYANEALLEGVGSDEHRAVAREAVSRSLVLLRNEENSLPLDDDIATLVVAGFADNIGIQSGGWTIEWQGQSGDITPGTTILEGIQNRVSSDTRVVDDPFARFKDFEPDELPVEACIGVIGEQPYAEYMGDSDDLALSDRDRGTVERLRENCETVIILILSGRPLIITDYVDQWDAAVAVWLPGTEGQGVADVLFGDQDFAGTLPYTWPRSVDQLPLNVNMDLSGNDPLFPFGYGLTYEP